MLMKPTSLYIHIPWCVRKCPYCDFNSHQADTIPAEDYIDCLLEDLTHDLEKYKITQPLHTIFIGGGTPSLFSAAEIGRLLAGVDQHWAISTDTEVTMEVNPGTVEHDNFADYRDAGINRVSMGIQSFNTEQLKILGRIHSSDEAKQAIDTLRQSFDNFNLDIMFGLPQQTLAEGLSDLQTAIDFAPTHLSWYQLTLEPNTVFYKKPPSLPDQDAIAELYEQGQALLAAHGYQQYEISAYAQPNRECLHNLNYWQFGDYLGIGAGAHGKITLPDKTVRTRKVTMPNSYLARSGQNYHAAEQNIEPDALLFEFLLNRLRLNRAIKVSELPDTMSHEMLKNHPAFAEALQQGLLTLDKNTIRKTELGERYLNDLLGLFL